MELITNPKIRKSKLPLEAFAKDPTQHLNKLGYT